MEETSTAIISIACAGVGLLAGFVFGHLITGYHRIGAVEFLNTGKDEVLKILVKHRNRERRWHKVRLRNAHSEEESDVA